MSGALYKLGSWIFGHKWRVMAVWFLAIIAFGAVALNFQKPFDSKITIPGTEAQVALDTLSKELPAASNASGTIVFALPEGRPILSQQVAITRTLEQIKQVDGVVAVVSPFEAQTISRNGQIAFAQIQLDKPAADVSDETRTKITDIIAEQRTAALQIETRGEFLTPAGAPAFGSAEVIGVAIAAMVLIITFGSLIAAGMPLLIALVAVALGMAGVVTASGFASISSVTPTLAIMLGLAVGIDYALFIIVKYIKYLRDGIAPQEAAGRAIATAGNAVIFAALTVIIALAALSITGIPFLSNMGIFAALTVAFAAVAAITLVPALLSLAKLKVLNRKARKQPIDAATGRQPFGLRWVSFVTKHAVIVIIGSVLVLGAVALPATKLYLGLPDDSTAARDTTERKAYDLLAEGFGEGFNGPLIVVAALPEGLDQAGVQQALGGTIANLQKDDNVAQAVPAGVSQDGRTAIIQVYPKTGPSAVETRDLIKRIRDDARSIAPTASSLSVTGATAVAVDVDQKLADALPLYLLVVVGLSLIILMAVFRSIVVPLKATLGFLLTIVATLGLLVMFFQWGWLGFIEPAPVLSFLPIIVTGILFGLAMDYQFFLVSGMHEAHAHHPEQGPRQAVINGYVNGAKVVTAAAIIMISVFGGFIFAHDVIIRSVGFALATGVFIDAFVVRMTIVPAVMTLFGNRAWWLPKWLGKLLPNLSIEGDESTFQKPRQ